MDLSILIVAYNVKDLVERCLRHISVSKDELCKEVIFVDNDSMDGTTAMIHAMFPWVQVIETEENLGFIRANNLAYAKAKGEYILMLNSDAFIGEHTLQKTIDFMRQNIQCGILGCRLVDENGMLQPSARYFPTPLRKFLVSSGIVIAFPYGHIFRGIDDMRWDHASIREVDWVPGCYLLIRKKIIDEMGYFLENKYFMYHDDVDLCLRIKRKGWKVFFYPETVVHLGGATSRKIAPVTKSGKQILKYQLESEFIFFRKNFGTFYVILDFILILLLEFLRIVNIIFRRRGAFLLRDRLDHLKLYWEIFIDTKLGQAAIH